MDKGRIDKLLEEARESLKVAEEVIAIPYDEFIRDVRNRYALRMALIEVVEALCNAGLHILREGLKVKAVEGYVEIIRKLIENSIISEAVGGEIEKLVRLRNLIVHRYWEVDDSRIYKEARGGLQVVKKFIEEVEAYVHRGREEGEV